ncbi:MAG: hypothetical protein Q9162_005091 [Coniocarpon cinnabarinum]
MSFEEFIAPLQLTDKLLPRLSLALAGTYKTLAENSSEQFLATPVNVLPNGSERGRMLAIDVGGSNLRVGFVDLLGDSTISRSYDRSWRIEDDVRTGVGQASSLFDWIGDRIAEVVAARQRNMRRDSHGQDDLGATISNATLMKLGKGFRMPGDPNLGRLILQGYSKHTQPPLSLPRIHIAAITNDSLATLASIAYESHPTANRRVVMGLIMGTGSNAAIIMDLDTLAKFKQESIELPAITDDEHTQIVINTEWSIKGSIGPIRDAGLVTKWDEQLDREGDDPGFMPFEYMTGGRYLGEIVRRILLDYFTQQGAPQASLPRQLCEKFGLHTNYLSDVLGTDISTQELLSRVREDLKPSNGTEWTWDEAKAEIARKAARAVQRRSSHLVAAAVLGSLICAGDFVCANDTSQRAQVKLKSGMEQELIVAYTGGVIAQFPHYLEDITRAITALATKLSHPDLKQTIELSEVRNGGVIGAGVMAGTVWNIPKHRRGSL